MIKNTVYKYFLRKSGHDKLPVKLIEDNANILSFHTTGETKLLKSSFKIISFDIFDTLIFHSAEPFSHREKQIAKLTVDILSEYDCLVSWSDLFSLRRAYFQQSKNLTGDEVNYEAAYKNILINLNLPIVQIYEITEKILTAEILYMCSATYLNKDVEKILVSLKENNKKVIAISDMYLPRRAIIEILIHHKIKHLIDEVFVSSDNYASKHSGGLYSTLALRGDMRPSDTVHIGDNYHSDVVMARKNGLHAYHYYNFSNELRKSNVKFQSINSISRKKQKKRPPFEACLATSFIVYIDYLINQCIRNQTEIIYFFTRDANFLLPFFKQYWKLHYSEYSICECSILATSRLLSFSLNYESENDFFNRLWSLDVDPNTASVETVLLKFEQETTSDFFQLDFWRHMSYQNARQDPEFVKFMNRLLLKIHDKTYEYIFSQNLIKYKKIALTDIGYSGTNYKELSDYIAKRGINFDRVDCYLYATNRHLATNAAAIIAPVFLHGHAVVSELSAPVGTTFNYSWLEPFTLDREKGRLLGYARVGDGTLDPVFAKPSEVSQLHSQAVNKLLVELQKNIVNKNNWHSNTELSALFDCVMYPNNITYELLSNMTHVHGYGNTRVGKIIDKLEIKNSAQVVNTASKRDLWLAGTAIRSKLGIVLPYIYDYLEIKKHIA